MHISILILLCISIVKALDSPTLENCGLTVLHWKPTMLQHCVRVLMFDLVYIMFSLWKDSIKKPSWLVSALYMEHGAELWPRVLFIVWFIVLEQHKKWLFTDLFVRELWVESKICRVFPSWEHPHFYYMLPYNVWLVNDVSSKQKENGRSHGK